MPEIFMIHSRYDTVLPNFFDKAAGMVDTSLVHMEWEGLVPPPWRHIRDILKNAEAVFLIKGPNIARSLYTSNWVSYEVGLAAHSRKKRGKGEMDVWVFESVHDPVLFPVAFLTDYVIYAPDDPYHIQYLRYILEAYNFATYRHPLPEVLPTKCWHDECQVEYNLHTVVRSWNCPSCQRYTEWTEETVYPDDALRIKDENFGIYHPGVKHTERG